MSRIVDGRRERGEGLREIDEARWERIPLYIDGCLGLDDMDRFPRYFFSQAEADSGPSAVGEAAAP